MHKEDKKPIKTRGTKEEQELTFKQPFEFVNARHNLTLIESRILMTMLYLSDKYMSVGASADQYGEIYDGEYNQKILKLPIPLLLGNEFSETKSKNYDIIFNAMASFNRKQISIYVSDDEWRTLPPFTLIEKKAGEGFITATIAPQTWKLISFMSSRFTCMRIDNILLMKSKYTIRMHQIVESLVRPVTYKIETLKKMFMVEDTYIDNNLFFQKVLNISQKELDKMGLTTFDYEKKSITETKKKGRQPITHITIIPSYNEILDDMAVRRLVKSKGITSILNEDEITTLIRAGFRKDEIIANAPSFYNFARVYDIQSELRVLEKDSEDKDNPKGWIISQIKRKIEILNL